jgi:hypothetical protein
MRRQGDVGDKLLLRGESAQIWAVFAEHHFDRFHSDSIDVCDIDAADSV